MNVYSYEDMRDHVADCRNRAADYERRAKSFSSWLFRDRDDCLKRAAFWREKAEVWDARIKEHFEAGVAARLEKRAQP